MDDQKDKKRDEQRLDENKEIKLESVRTILTRLTKEINQIECRYQKVIDTLNDLETQADTDELTGLLRRAAFEKKWKFMLKDAQRMSTHCGILILDLDYFKKINDQYGHQVGDDALRALARLLKQHCFHPQDPRIVGRFGGEEFVVASIEKESKLRQLAEVIRHAVTYLHLDFDEAHPLFNHPMSISIGLAHSTKAGFEVGALFLQADEALYKAKASGRNQLRVA